MCRVLEVFFWGGDGLWGALLARLFKGYVRSSSRRCYPGKSGALSIWLWRRSGAKMLPESLEFQNLPLARVELRIVFSEQILFTEPAFFASLTSSVMWSVAPMQELEFQQGFPAPVIGFGYTFAVSPGLEVRFQSDRFVCIWSNTVEGTYPRYSRLKEVGLTFLAAIEKASNRKLASGLVNMYYWNFIRGDAAIATSVPRKYLNPIYLPALADGNQLSNFECSWAMPESSVERGLLFSLAQSTTGSEIVYGTVLRTSSGKRIKNSAEASDTWDACHKDLQMYFVDLLTEFAKTEWGLKK